MAGLRGVTFCSIRKMQVDPYVHISGLEYTHTLYICYSASMMLYVMDVYINGLGQQQGCIKKQKNQNNNVQFLFC